MYGTEQHGGRTRFVCTERGCKYATMRAVRMEGHQRVQHHSKVAIPQEEQESRQDERQGTSDAPTVYMLRVVDGDEYVTAIAEDEVELGEIADGLAYETEAEAQEVAEGLEGVEIVEVTIDTTPDLDEFLAGKVAEVTARVAEATDVTTLQLLRTAEAAKPKFRKGVLSAIDARIADLGEA